MNPHTMTIDEVRDWLAREAGWTIYTDGLPVPHYLAPGKHPDAECQLDHPIPTTLDAAAKALPEGWWWTKDDGVWAAGRTVGGNAEVWVTATADETLDRFRLAVLCRRAAKENPR